MPDKGVPNVQSKGELGDVPSVNEAEEYLQKTGWEEVYSKSGKYLGYFRKGWHPIEVLSLVQAYVRQKNLDSLREKDR